MISIGYICQFHCLALPIFPLFNLHLQNLISILQFSYIKLFWQKLEKQFRFSSHIRSLMCILFSLIIFLFLLSPQCKNHFQHKIGCDYMWPRGLILLIYTIIKKNKTKPNQVVCIFHNFKQCSEKFYYSCLLMCAN